MRKVEILRKKYPRFLYKDFKTNLRGKELEIFFNFEIPPDISFCPKLKIKNVSQSKLKKIEKETLENLVFHLGLMEVPSYWKLTCSPIIEIQAGFLNSEQIKCWKDLIIKGMGQYFFENKIDFRKPNFLKIISSTHRGFKKFKGGLDRNKFLVPMGEGKDSIVTLELLKKSGVNLNCFVNNSNKIHFKILKKASIKKPIIVEREIDPKLLELNRKDFLNGHTPITALISFLAVFCAVLFRYDNVVFSNERSSNEGNVKYLGKIINHQYSKSFEFEKKFRAYIKKYLAPNLNYFSFLRPLYEIQIAKIFANLPQYFPLFLSCNQAKKTYSGIRKPSFKWCCNCPKCLFVFTILYPFLEEKQIIKIFRQNLFNKKELLLIILQLIGGKDFKPFECVGTKKENLVAFYLSLERTKEKGKLPFILKYFQNKILPRYPNLKKTSKNIMNSWNNQNNLPKNLEKILKNSLKI